MGNLISNPGFEDGLTDWAYYAYPLDAVVGSGGIELTDVYSGTSSGRVDISNITGLDVGAGLIQRWNPSGLWPLSPDREYRIRVAYKSEVGARLIVLFMTQDYTPIAAFQTTVPPALEWSQTPWLHFGTTPEYLGDYSWQDVYRVSILTRLEQVGSLLVDAYELYEIVPPAVPAWLLLAIAISVCGVGLYQIFKSS